MFCGDLGASVRVKINVKSGKILPESKRSSSLLLSVAILVSPTMEINCNLAVWIVVKLLHLSMQVFSLKTN